MKLRRRHELHGLAWSPPFALALVVFLVQIFMILYLLAASRRGVEGDFLAYQAFVDIWTDGGALERGWAFELMRVNVLFAVYFWVMSRSLHPIRDARHRWALLGSAWLLLALQSLWSMVPKLAKARFTLIPLEL